MTTRIGQCLRYGFAAALFFAGAQGVQAQSADALSVVVDQRGEVYRVNYQCDLLEDCTQTIELLTRTKVKQASAVGIGRKGARNYVFVGNTGKRSGIRLFVENDPDALWDTNNFSSVGTNALVVARNAGTLFVERSPNIEAYVRDPGIDLSDPLVGYSSTPTGTIGPVEFGNGSACQSIVSLEEYPASSGNLLAFCGSPVGIIGITFGSGGAVTLSDVLPPNDLGTSLSGGAVTSIPVPFATPNNDGLFDYALLNTGNQGVAALNLENGTLQSNLVAGSGNLRSNATALCNFINPGNDIDDDEDVDSPCLVFTQPGGTGLVTLAELKYESGLLNATVREGVDEVLKNPFGIDFINSGSVLASTCLPENGGCQVANNLLTLNPNLPNVMNNLITFGTQGPFYDDRYLGNDGDGNPVCDDRELPLDFTGIPVFENFSIGAEFCARDGFFFVDVIADDGALGQPTRGITTWETPGTCWEPGLPFIGLDDVEYGLLSPDQFDLAPLDGMDTPLIPAGTDIDGTYANNRFVQDRLVGCGSRVRAGNRLTFVVEDFFGNELEVQIADASSVLDPTTALYRYGEREFAETFDILLDAPQSGCSDDPLNTPECVEFGTNSAQATFGWQIQRSSGVSEEELISIAAPVAQVSFPSIEGVDVNLAAVGGGGTLGNKTVAGTTAVGVTGGIAGNELSPDGGEAIVVDFSTSVEGFDVENLPMVVKSFEGAFLYDGPFGDVQEELVVTATTADGSTIVGRLRAVGDGGAAAPLWILDSGSVAATAVNTDGGVIRTPDYPFGGDTLIVGLRFEAATDKSCGSGACDGSLLNLEVEIPSRIDNLALAYNGLVKALCPVADRPDFVTGGTDPSRPKICGTGNGPFPSVFNTPGGTVESPRNISGDLQATTEALARFVSHNICQLDFTTDVDPGEIGFGTGDSFCTTPPEWSVRPTAP